MWFPLLTRRSEFSTKVKKCLAYEAHTACDKHNLVLGFHGAPENVHDSAAFDPLYNELYKYYPERKTVVADSATKRSYAICGKTMWIYGGAYPAHKTVPAEKRED